MATQPLLTLEEVAGLCGVTLSSVRRWLVDSDDPLPSQMLGALRRVVLPDVMVEWAKRRNMLLLGDPAEVARPWPRAEPTPDGRIAT